MNPPRDVWAKAFAIQARSDFTIYRKLLGESDVAACHRLHYLQMATEKIAKAYRIRDTTTSEEVLRSHVGFSKFISSFVLSPPLKLEYKGKQAQLRGLLRDAKMLAGAIEKLAPAIAPDQTPQNTEYPWQEGESVIAPCRYSFPNLSMLNESGGRTFLKLIERALRDFEAIQLA